MVLRIVVEGVCWEVVSCSAESTTSHNKCRECNCYRNVMLRGHVLEVVVWKSCLASCVFEFMS